MCNKMTGGDGSVLQSKFTFKKKHRRVCVREELGFYCRRGDEVFLLKPSAASVNDVALLPEMFMCL